jgi:beta-lactamase regulating signal transducer with metallopeptidase domain
MEAIFLQNMGRVLIASFLQFGVLYLLYAVLKNTLLKKISASTDFLVLLGLLITGTGLFIAGICRGGAGDHNNTLFILNEIGGRWNDIISTVLYWMAVVYIMVATARTLFVFWRSSSDNYHKNADPVSISNDFKEYLDAFCHYLQLKTPRILFSKKAKSPFVSGILRSVIVIPAYFQSCFTPQEMEAVILHELAHLKRYDLLINCIVVLCAQLLFFNPFAVLLIRRLRLQREVACDDWVIAHNVSRKHYATALYKAARFQQTPAWLLAMGARKGELFSRIERLLSKKQNHLPYKINFTPFILLLIALPMMVEVRRLNNSVTEMPAQYNAGAKNIILPGTEIMRPGILNSPNTVNSGIGKVAALKLKPVVTAQTVKQATNTEKEPGLNSSDDKSMFVELVSDEEVLAPGLIFVSDGTKRSNDVVLRFSDSVNLYSRFISRSDIESVTAGQLENIMGLVAMGMNNNLDKNGNKLIIESPGIPVNVTTQGEKNLYYRNASLQQQIQYDAYFQQWKIQFTIMNGKQQLGNRFVTIYQKKVLQSASL